LSLMAVVMVKMYLDQQRRSYSVRAKMEINKIQADQSAILVAQSEIRKGTIIEPGMLVTKIFPNQYVAPQAVSSLDRIAGMIATADIGEDEQVTLTKVAPTTSISGLAAATPVGKRAITIAVDSVSTLSGMLKPGDYVDVLTAVQIPVQTQEGERSAQVAVVPLLQNVLVLAMGQSTASVPKGESRYRKEEGSAETTTTPFVTLAVTPQEATLVAFVQEQGKIRLVLRSPADSQVEPIQPASWETLFQYIMPAQEGAQSTEANKEPEKPAPPTSYVEIYRGLRKEKVPLSQ